MDGIDDDVWEIEDLLGSREENHSRYDLTYTGANDGKTDIRAIRGTITINGDQPVARAFNRYTGVRVELNGATLGDTFVDHNFLAVNGGSLKTGTVTFAHLGLAGTGQIEKAAIFKAGGTAWKGHNKIGSLAGFVTTDIGHHSRVNEVRAFHAGDTWAKHGVDGFISDVRPGKDKTGFRNRGGADNILHGKTALGSQKSPREVLEVNGNIAPHRDARYSLGKPNAAWSEIHTINGVVTRADIRGKKTEPSTLGLDFIRRLQTRTGEGGWHSLMAQDVKHAMDAMGIEFAGWLLSKPDDPNSRQSLRLDQFIAPLVNAVQELDDAVSIGGVSDDDDERIFAGKVSIGSNRSPKEALDVNGNIAPQRSGSYTLGTPDKVWSEVYTQNGVLTKADVRERKSVPSLLGLTFIQKLRPRSSGKWHGLIAQHVKEAIDAEGAEFGGWVLANPDDPESRQSLRMDQFIAPLIRAVQELSAKVEYLEHRSTVRRGLGWLGRLRRAVMPKISNAIILRAHPESLDS